MTETPNFDLRGLLPQYQGQEPLAVDSIVHDHVAGTEITIWFQTAAGPVGLKIFDDVADELFKRLRILLTNVE